MKNPLVFASRTIRPRGRVWRTIWTWSAALTLLAAACYIAGCHHEGAEHPIVNISELIHWNSHPKAARMPVRLPAVVTYYDPSMHVVYLQDQTGGVGLDTGQRTFSMKAWDSVELSGYATGAGTRTVLHLEDMSFTPVGKFEAPAPVELKVREIADGVLMSNWVKVRGMVRYVGMQDNKLILHLAYNGDVVNVIVHEHGSDLSNLVDSLAEVTGVVAPAPNYDPTHPHAQLLVAYPEFITKASSAIDPWKLPVQAIRDAKKLDPKSLSTRVRIQGHFVRAASNGDWIVSDADGQEIRVQTISQNAPNGNDALDIAGYLGSSEAGLTLLDSVVNVGIVIQGPTVEAVTTIEKLHKLTPEQAASAIPVHLKEATITYFDPSWQLMFVQDSTAASFVEIQNEHQPLQTGDVISLDGVSSPGGFAPDIAQPVLHFIRKGSLPKPDLPITDDFLQGREDSRWVKVSGVIRSVDAHADRTFLVFAHSSAEMRVQVPVPSAFQDPEGLVDSEVELEGVSGSLVNQKMQLTGLTMFIPAARSEEHTSELQS